MKNDSENEKFSEGTSLPENDKLTDGELDAVSGGAYSDLNSAPHENYDRFFEWAMNLPPTGKHKGKTTN